MIILNQGSNSERLILKGELNILHLVHFSKLLLQIARDQFNVGEHIALQKLLSGSFNGTTLPSLSKSTL